VNGFSLNILVDSDNGKNVVDSSTVFKLVWTNLRYEMSRTHLKQKKIFENLHERCQQERYPVGNKIY
jgi:hypothetical protein